MRRSSRFQRPGLSGSSRSVVLLGGDGGGPSLDLDFSFGTLDPRITFTRSTVGTYYRGAFNQNLLLRSQEFDNTTSWANAIGGTGVNPVRTTNNAVAPDGTTTADTITFNTGANTTTSDISFIQQTPAFTTGLQYTLSFWIRGTVGGEKLTVRHLGGGAYTLVTATTSWQRVSITETSNAGANVQIGIRQNISGHGVINSTATVELWGAQLTEGSLLTPYIPTTTAAITQGQIASVAIDVPRFEYNPVSGAFRGLLIEGGATNLCQQSAAVRTSPWVTAGLTTAGASITAPDGSANGVEIVGSNGTTAGNAFTYQQVAGSPSSASTFSIYLKAKGTAINTGVRMTARAGVTDLSGCTVVFNHTDGTISAVTGGTWTSTSATVTPVGNNWYRVTLTGTPPATTDNIRAIVYNNATGNGTDGVYAWGAQVEAQAFASSYIPTVGGTVARGADLADITGSAFSSWFNQSEGTLYAEQQVYALIGNSAAAFIQQDGSNYYEIGQGIASLSANMVRFYVQLAGGNDVVLTTVLTGLSVGNTIRSAAAYRVNDVAFSGNANTVQTDNTFTIQTPVSMGLGRPRGGDLRSILLRRISYWPTRLPNDQLVSLTTIPSTALAMTAIQAGAKIDLTWTQVPGVEGATYEVERSTDGGATWSPLTTSFGLAFNDTTALYPGTYTYRVRANVGGEVTDWSSQVSETTVDVPSAPGSLTVTGATTSSISLSWTDATGEDSYGIEVSPDGLAPWGLAGTAPANTTTFTHTGLAESVQRYYRVNGINKAGGGVYSSTVNSWTVPLAPTSLTATAVSSSQIDLNWTDVSTGNTSYKVERSTDNVNWTQIATGLAANATSYSAVGLTGSTLYYFRVRAANAARDSAYSNTASATTQAGGLVPSWSLDFSSGTPSGYTLTRASTGRYVDSSGYIASASTDIARLTHNSSGSRLGLLVEEQRANLLLRSEEFNQTGGWPTLIGVSIGANVTTAPDNTSNADELIEDSATNNHRVSTGSRTVSQSLPYTASCYVKANNRSYCAVTIYATGGTGARFCQVFDLTGSGALGSTDTLNSPTGTSGTITAVGNGWFRVTATMDSQTNTSIQVAVSASNSATPSFTSQAPSYLGAGNSAIYVWGAQLEQGSAATSYIPTTTATVTRSADLAHVLDSSITSWGDPGALVVHFYQPGQAGTLLSTDDASTAQVGIEASTTTAARAFWSSGSTATGTIGSGVQKAVHYWNGSTSKFCINGGTVQSGTNNLTIANTDFVTLGAEATDSSGVPGTFSQYANCIIRKVEFYSGALTDANLQTITT